RCARSIAGSCSRRSAITSPVRARIVRRPCWPTNRSCSSGSARSPRVPSSPSPPCATPRPPAARTPMPTLSGTRSWRPPTADPRGLRRHRDRGLPARRPMALRLMDWREVYEAREKGELGVVSRQAGRCMDCGIPFCHQGCPLGNLIPEWNELVYREDWREASERLHATNNFPEFTGRACPAPCESSCVLGINQPPVTIKNIEVSITDRAYEEGWVRPVEPARHTGRSVAVVGSGPAGLAAAQQLTRAGHSVVVLEKDDRPGGLLRYGIPEFKLEKRHLERRLAQ